MADSLKELSVDKFSSHPGSFHRERASRLIDHHDRGDRLTTIFSQTNLNKSNNMPNLSSGLNSLSNSKLGLPSKTRMNFALTQNNFNSAIFPGSKKSWGQPAQNLTQEIYHAFDKPEVYKSDANEMRVGTHLTKNFYEEDVRQLDNWNIETKKKKILKTGVKYKDILKPTKITEEHTNNFMFPSINSQVINRILKDSDDEEEFNLKSDENVVTQIRLMVNFETTKAPKPGTDTHANLEFRVKEGKEDIARDLVIKKLREHIKDEDMEIINSDYFQNKMQAVAKNALSPFKCLKGTLVSTNVEQCVKFVTDTRGKDLNPKRVWTKGKKGSEPQTTELIVNYKDIEEALHKDLERVHEVIVGYDCRRSYLTRQINKLAKELKYHEEQLEKISIVPTENELDSQTPTSAGTKSQQGQNSAKLKQQQRIKMELKQQKMDMLKKIEEVEKKLFMKNNEVMSVEQDIKTGKENRIKYKLQLRDLYHDLLKDEAYLVKSNNNLSYTWVLHALWDMNQDVDSSAFPAFLDQDSVYFINEFAKVQYVLLQFVLENKLFENILDLEALQEGSTKEMASLIIAKQPKKKDRRKTTIIREPPSASIKSKSLHSLMDDFQERIKTMKRENLKTKEPANIVQAKSKASRIPFGLKYWDPTQMRSVPVENLNPSEEGSTAAPKGRRDHFLEDHERNGSHPRAVAHKVLKELEKMRENEKQRLFKKHVTRTLEGCDRECLFKALIFLFGKLEGEEILSNLLKEQRKNDQRHNLQDLQPGKTTNTKTSPTKVRQLTVLTHPTLTHIPTPNKSKANLSILDQSAALARNILSPFEISKSASLHRTGGLLLGQAEKINEYVLKSMSATTRNNHVDF